MVWGVLLAVKPVAEHRGGKGNPREEKGTRTAEKQEVKHHAQVLDKKGRQLLSWKHHDHSRFDSSAFEQDHDELYQQYSKTSTRRVLRVG